MALTGARDRGGENDVSRAEFGPGLRLRLLKDARTPLRSLKPEAGVSGAAGGDTSAQRRYAKRSFRWMRVIAAVPTTFPALNSALDLDHPLSCLLSVEAHSLSSAVPTTFRVLNSAVNVFPSLPPSSPHSANDVSRFAFGPVSLNRISVPGSWSPAVSGHPRTVGWIQPGSRDSSRWPRMKAIRGGRAARRWTAAGRSSRAAR